MLSHKVVNDWQKGLLSLFGKICPLYWSVLWVLCRESDEDGFVTLHQQDMANALVRDYQRISQHRNSIEKRMRKNGLLKVARKRTVQWSQDPSNGQWIMTEKTPRVLQIYAGIREGKIPAGAERLNGLSAYYFYKGKNARWQTYKLIRKKFKTKSRP